MYGQTFFAGEEFRDLEDCRQRAHVWCRDIAGLRVHGTTRQRPAEVFAAEERLRLAPAPSEPFDLPSYSQPKVAPDRHVQVNRSLCRVPGDMIGQRLTARADSRTVKLYWRGQLIKLHPVVAPGRRHTDPADLPAELTTYAMRDRDALRAKPPPMASTSARMRPHC